MSEDYSFNRNQKKEDERRLAPDFFVSLGKGMLLASEGLETLKYSSGLTPLCLGDEINKRGNDLNPFNMIRIEPQNLKSDYLGEGLAIEGTETRRRLSGLSVPLSLRGESHNQNLKSDYLCEGLATEGTETRRRLSGLSVPLSIRGEFHKRGDLIER
ncbi:MAG: hypothetical protein Q7U60_10785 [Candidatus Methanoperedens sp.]|nr:hypothetical protein [Candidatus Methanoperedens sp.]